MAQLKTGKVIVDAGETCLPRFSVETMQFRLRERTWNPMVLLLELSSILFGDTILYPL